MDFGLGISDSTVIRRVALNTPPPEDDTVEFNTRLDVSNPFWVKYPVIASRSVPWPPEYCPQTDLE